MTDTLDLSNFESEEDLKGYDYPKEGQYHLVVNAIDSTREKVDAVKFDLQVLAGNVAGQTGKTFWETFWDPSEDQKDRGRFATKRLASFAVAIGLITPAQLGQKGGVSIDWAEAVGRQFVATTVEYKRKDDSSGKVYEGAEIDGLKIYRVTDSEVAEVPKDKEALALITGAVTPATAPAPAAQPAQTAAPAASGGSSKFDNF